MIMADRNTALVLEGRLTVIRPIRKMEVSRMEKDTKKLTSLYQEGYDEANRLLPLINKQR